MSAINRKLGFAVVLALGLVGTGVASATPTVMQFDHLGSTNQYVNQYYNGGCTSNLVGSPAPTICDGPNYGVVWEDAVGGGSSSSVSNVPSPPGWMVFQPGNTGLMNVSAGFSTGFSFFYSELEQAGSLSLWSGLNATGTRLGGSPLTLSVTDSSCGRAVLYCNWQPFGVTFSGTAKSVSFTGLVDGVALFDNVTLGSATPITSVPEPAELGMFGLGLLLIGGFIGLRQRDGRRSNKEALS